MAHSDCLDLRLEGKISDQPSLDPWQPLRRSSCVLQSKSCHHNKVPIFDEEVELVVVELQ